VVWYVSFERKRRFRKNHENLWDQETAFWKIVTNDKRFTGRSEVLALLKIIRLDFVQVK